MAEGDVAAVVDPPKVGFAIERFQYRRIRILRKWIVSDQIRLIVKVVASLIGVKAARATELQYNNAIMLTQRREVVRLHIA